MRKSYLSVLVILAAYYGWEYFDFEPQFDDSSSPNVTVLAEASQNRKSNFQIEGEGEVARISSFDDSSSPNITVLAKAFQNRKSNFQIEGEGKVARILSDDNDGSRHQRFVLELISGQTILVAHNIDLAPRISLIKEGDLVSFNGEYEWNSQGGVIHWTHHDPQGIHVTGWLKHNGRTYK